MKRSIAILIAMGVMVESVAAQAIHHKCQGEFKGQPTACIKAPRDGATVKTGASVKVSLTGVDVGDAHYHLFLDTNVPPEGQAIPEGPGIARLGKGVKEHSFAAVSSGTHRLIVVLGDGGHVPIARQKADTAYFTVPVQ